MQGYVQKIIPFSAVDGPGNRTAVFLQGCNFTCAYCHNPETQMLYDSSLPGDGVRAIDHRDLGLEVLRYRDFIQGVTISGGECTLQYEFLLELSRYLQSFGIEVFVDTNAHLAPAAFQLLGRHVDKFIIDVKASDEGEHMALTGVGNNLVLANLRYALAEKLVYEIRTVIVPDVLNNEQTVAAISRLISADQQVRYKLIRFRPQGVIGAYARLPGPTDEYMAALQRLALAFGVKTCEKN
ncbi:MAG: putative glycyl-radical enzyme activating enzyme YjjW [Firmicutes bacterium]|nr:putative glycyl-radical enzyme activating enzyme YjjW [Bacillota bacterium]MBT9158406.1 putative glycyl-radical enzyme activating enzyme YjjW [Bacillota bacterium]